MYVSVSTERAGSGWKDPLLAHLYSYANQAGQKYARGLLLSMDEVFQFLENRLVEYLEENPEYRKPANLFITYSRPSCCRPSIHINYMDQSIRITEKEESEQSTVTVGSEGEEVSRG